MTAKPGWLDEIDHTADTGIRVTADSRQSLFERAAYGMFWLLTDLDLVVSAEETVVEIDADDPESLMVRWLSELNYRHQVDARMFSGFRIERMGDTHLRARTTGEKFDPARHRVYGEIKAVTYHDIKIARENGRWTARIIFDL